MIKFRGFGGGLKKLVCLAIVWSVFGAGLGVVFGAGYPPEFAPSGESVRADVFNRVIMDIYRQLGRGEKVIVQVMGAESDLDETIEDVLADIQAQIDVLHNRQSQIESGQWFGASNQAGVVSRTGNVMIGELGSTSDKLRLIGDMSIKGGNLRIGDNASNRPLSVAGIAPQIAIANSAGEHIWYISVPASSDISQSYNINRAGMPGTQFKIDPRAGVGRTYITQPIVFAKSGSEAFDRYITDDTLNYRLYISTDVFLDGGLEVCEVLAESIEGEDIRGDFFYGDISNTVGLNEDMGVRFYEVALSTEGLRADLVSLSTTTEQGFYEVSLATGSLAGALSNHTGDSDIHFSMGEIAISSSQVSGLGGFLTSEVDPVFTGSPAYDISGSSISAWNTAVDDLSTHTGNSGIHFEMGDILISTSQVSGLDDIGIDDSHLAKLDDDNTFTGENIFNSPIIHGAGLHSIGGDPRGTGAVDLQTTRNYDNQVASGDYSVIGGGLGNKASGLYSSIGGGRNNTAADRASVGGGDNNIASGIGATVAGGRTNTASGYRAFVGSGQFNTASGEYAVVCGGYNNTASGNQSSILGGSNVGAKATGASAMGDGQGDGFINNTPNSLAVRFDNGVRFAKTATTDLMTIDKEGAVQAKSSMVANSFKQEPIALNIENALEKSRNMSAVDNGIGMRKMDYSSIPVEVISQQTVIKRSVRDKKTGIVYDDIKDLPNIEVKSGGETISEKVEYDLIEEEYTYPIVDIAGLIELNRLAVLELEDRVEELENHIKIIHEVFNKAIVEGGGEEIDFGGLVAEMKQSGGNITAGVVSAVAIILAVFGLLKKEDDEGGVGGIGERN